MKKLYIIGAFMALMGAMSACTKDADGVAPSKIADLTAEPREGAVILRWNVPVDSAYMYVRVEYQNHQTGKMMARNVSVYQDTLLVDGLLNKDGAYTFDVYSISVDNVRSEVNQITATALPVQPKLTKVTEKIDMTADNVSTNAQEPSEGPIANLVDGNYKNFFHSKWSSPVPPAPHYIDIALPKPVEKFEIKTWYRGGSFGQCPTEITVLGSNDANTWEVIGEMSDTGVGKSTYTTPVLGEEGKPYTYIRYRADVTSGNSVYFALAEMEISKVRFDIYDPEGIYRPEE